MAIITEMPEEEVRQEPQTRPEPEQKRPKQQDPTTPPTLQSPPANPFVFWCYFTLTVSLITFLFASFYSPSPPDPKSWFLSLPDPLRHHFAKGRFVKIQTFPDSSPVEVFAVEKGPIGGVNVLLIHGLGVSSYSFRSVIESLSSKGVHVVAIDLPGSGFSDKSVVVEEEVEVGALGRFWDVYGDIKEKGVFWAFDQIIETGQMPYQELDKPRISRRKSVKVLELGSEEMGRVLTQVIQTMGLAPVHLVLHDTALSMSANWVLSSLGLVRSVTLIDTAPNPTLPLWVLSMPVVGDAVLGVSYLYNRLIDSFCKKGMSSLDAEAHRVLLKERDGRRAVLGMGRKLNSSFDVAEWGGLEELSKTPIQVLWSSSYSNEWSEEGNRISNAIPHAKFVAHSGGRCPQEDAADELADNIFELVSSIPKTVRKVEEEHLPEHIQKMSDEATSKDDHNHHHQGHGAQDHHHGHGHSHMGGAGGYMDAYGLGGGWAE
ncbi:protein AUXIN RESPONSE 4 [Punica granatum]|uniref:AB hydrolase-1 domain-containing protein n=2 Tax=Punica granatum TaxID=22663 RepID=A0A218XL09_PUNGR|nr:protein AUXIN RESPONSE 4 [Punica granatum]OWM85359.1 hypothetical protein CDL15_Pgr018983 [Punica granatum]PKI74060.1 hypothetical protein CRG98_005538 [Punica granatum]